MKYFVYIFLSLFIIRAQAQITITTDDLMDVGDSVSLAMVADIPPGFNPGPAGANQHWDFSNLVMDTTSQLKFVDPATTPYGADFPTSNIAVVGLVDNLIEGAWAYATKNSFVFQIDGLGGSYDIFEDITAELDPPEVMFNFPVNYLDSMEGTSTVQIEIPSPEPPADSIRLKVITTVNSVVDGWGELTTPTWTGDVLRFKDVRTTIDSVWVKLFFFWAYLESSTSVSVTYKYIANDLGYAALQFNSDTSGTEYSGVNYILDAGVGEQEFTSQTNIDLEIYPNPAFEFLNARWTDKKSGTYSLVDMYGRAVKHHDFNNSREIKLQTSNLPSGLYILNIVYEGEKEFISEKVLIK